MSDEERWDPPEIPEFDDDEDQAELEFVNREPEPEIDEPEAYDEPAAAPEPPAPEPIVAAAAGAAAGSVGSGGASADGDGGPKRKRGGTRGRDQGPNRLMLGVLVVVVAAAVFIFWPRGGGELPEGLGEQYSVVTRDSATAYVQPRSGEVDLDAEAPAVVPEEVGAVPAAADDNASEEAPAAQAPAVQAPAASVTRTETPAPAATAPAAPAPGESGDWAVQLSAFAAGSGAEQEAARWRARGVDGVRVHSSTRPGDPAPHKVWVAFFGSRNDAVAWQKDHAALIGSGPFVVKR